MLVKKCDLDPRISLDEWPENFVKRGVSIWPSVAMWNAGRLIMNRPRRDRYLVRERPSQPTERLTTGGGRARGRTCRTPLRPPRGRRPRAG